MKRLFVLIHLGLIFMIADAGVSVFYGYVVEKFNTSDSLSVSQARQTAAEQKKFLPQSHYAQVTQRDLFQTNVVKAPPAPKVAAPEKEPEKEIQLTKLKLELKGTITGTGSEPLAVINKKGDPRQMLYAEGDFIEQATIKSIMKGRVVLLVNGREEILEMLQKDNAEETPKHAPVLSNAAQVDTKDGFVEKVALSRDDISNLMAKSEDIRKQVRVRHYIRRGKMEGFRLTNIQKDSLLSTKLGLKNGDVISGINDKDIKSIHDVAQIYETFNQKEGPLNSDVKVLRNGKSGTIQYSIK